jgi:hypothetical protein
MARASRAWRRAAWAAGLILGASSRPARAQQTIFNVPSTEVLDPRQTYAELDLLGVHHDPGSVQLSTRTAYGVGGEVESRRAATGPRRATRRTIRRRAR